MADKPDNVWEWVTYRTPAYICDRCGALTVDYLDHWDDCPKCGAKTSSATTWRSDLPWVPIGCLMVVDETDG